MNQTALHPQHLQLNAKMVDFGGWHMPLNYGSQIEEHHQVRRDAGMFDVSHMTIVDLHGQGVSEFLGHLLTNDVHRLKVAGKALYTCMLREDGGIIDDLIVYYLSESFFRLVVNAGTRAKDLAWIERQAAPFDVEVSERDELAMIAVQGPKARDKVHRALPADAAAKAAALKPFVGVAHDALFIARTGYTGEDGYEIMLPNAVAPALWQALLGAGVKPCGLGARDTLRLEAGMNLYGSDMDESTTPLVSGLGWVVAWEPATRNFIGRSALERQRAQGQHDKFVGLVLNQGGVLRSHQPVLVDGEIVGEITSGSFSPTLGCSVALARIRGHVNDNCTVGVRGKPLPVRLVKPPFVRNGQSCLAPS